MTKSRRFAAFDFTALKPEQVQHILKDLYATGQGEHRDSGFGQMTDRRQVERRQENRAVLLDTRSTQSRRRSAGRRRHDENQDNKHKVGIDYYI